MIKKNFLLIGLMLLLPALPVCAQKKFHLIPKFGRVFSNVTNIESEMKSGAYLGLGFDWRITRSLGIETGLYYAQYGTKNALRREQYIPELDITVSAKYSTVKINYAQLPLMAKYYVYKGLHVAAGAQLDYRINTSEDGFVSVIGDGRDFDVDGIIGVGYQFDFGLLLSANYIAGITNLDPSYTRTGIYSDGEPYTYTFESQHHRNTALRVSIGWRF